MKKVFILFLLLSCELSFSQSKVHLQTFVGIEGGIMLAIPKIEDPGNQLIGKWTNNGSLGIILKQEVFSNIFISLGVFTQKYNNSFRFKDDEATTAFKKINLYRFPLKVAYEIPLHFGVPELQIGLSMGTSYYLNKNAGMEELKTGFIGSDIKNSYYLADSKYSDNKFGLLLDGGLYINILMAKGTILSFGANYFIGLNNLHESTVRYKKGLGFEEINAKINGSGDQLNVWIGFQYPISKLWKKKDPRPEAGERIFFK